MKPAGRCANCPRPKKGPGRFWSDRGHRGALILLCLLGLGLAPVPMLAGGRYLVPLLVLVGPGLGGLIGRTYADGWTAYPLAYAAGLGCGELAELDRAVLGLAPAPFALLFGAATVVPGWLAGWQRHGR